MVKTDDNRPDFFQLTLSLINIGVRGTNAQ